MIRTERTAAAPRERATPAAQRETGGPAGWVSDSPLALAQGRRLQSLFGHAALVQRQGAVVQRTVATAAQALLDAGNNDKMKKKAYTDWLKTKVGSGQAKQANSALHGVGEADFDAVVLAITGLMAGGAAQKRLDDTQKRLTQALLEARQVPAGGVSLTVGQVTGYLDADQLPHQPQGGEAIGTRVASKKKDSRFGDYADAAWHQANTLVTMTTWAAGLGLADGDNVPTGQATERADGIYYEGMALRVNGHTYVFFHCYPGPNFEAPA